MPAASISNGHTGPLKNATLADVAEYRSLMRAGASGHSPNDIAHDTLGRQLHVAEFWMPGGCNLHCSHCYVASWPERTPLELSHYETLARRMVGMGLVDIVIPGMEPLMRAETWAVVNAAHSAGARSIGMTTNGTLLKRRLAKVVESALTVVNVSLDGPRQVHDAIRGKGVYKVVMDGVRALREAAPDLRLISNCTVSRENVGNLAEVAATGREHGLTFSAFHPFERSAEIDNSLELTAAQTVDGYETLRTAFEQGKTGSIVLEMEASRLDVLLEMSERGWFNSMDLLSDETGFLFYASRHGDDLLLVNLMAYPHHFIRTLRVADDGGLSSCRGMARTGWQGIGDLRTDNLQELLRESASIEALGSIWAEFAEANARAPEGSMERFLTALVRTPADHQATGLLDADAA